MIYLYLNIALILILWSISFLIHMPRDVQRTIFGQVFLEEPVYMDVYSDDYTSLFVNPCKLGFSQMWHNTEILFKYCSSERTFPLPYRDYYYDKPLLTGSLWLVSTSTPALLQLSFEYKLLFFYTVFSLIVALSLTIHTVYIHKLGDFLKTPLIYRFISTISCSLIVYAIYNWEAVTLVFLTLFIYYYVKGFSSRALVMLSLFSSMNTYGLVLVSLILYQYLVSRDREDYKALLGLTPLIFTFGLLSLLSPRSLLNQILWFEKSICNNCLFLIVTRDAYSEFNWVLSFIAWFVTYLALIPFKPHGLLGEDGFSYLTIFIALTNILLPKLTPQQLLYILPYLPLLYASEKRARLVAIHYAVDGLNSAIIILWFKDSVLRRMLDFIGLSQSYNPLSLDSPIQWIAQARNIILLIHILAIASSKAASWIPKLESKHEESATHLGEQ